MNWSTSIVISAIACFGSWAQPASAVAVAPDVIFSDKPLMTDVGPVELLLRDGSNTTVTIFSTPMFNKVFENYTTASLIFNNYEEDELDKLPNVNLKAPGFIFRNKSVSIVPLKPVRVTVKSYVLVLNRSGSGNDTEDVDNIFFRVSAYKLDILITISEIVGWLYFIAWSVSFYPQVYQNWSRKSVRGLSLDFVFLNITGFCVYGIYNVGLFWVQSVQVEYLSEDPTGVIPVQPNDVAFTFHAIFASGIIAIQCLIYDKGSQTITNAGRTVLCGIFSFLFIILIVAISNAITWLLFLSMCSYVKLFITLIKYIPQAYLNWSRQSTSGWSIGNILLDFTGGLLSILQMFIISYNFDDWISLFGDFTKFGLGLFSVCFDIFFIVQHYVLYKNHRNYEPIEGGTIINNESGIASSNHHHHNEDLVTSRQHERFEAADDDEQRENSIHEILDSTSTAAPQVPQSTSSEVAHDAQGRMIKSLQTD